MSFFDDLGSRSKPFIIAEIAQAHDGSLGQAHAFIDLIADAGADAVKFQTHIADAESTYDEPWRVKFSLQDATRFDYWRRMEFTPEQWVGLAEHAEKRDLAFISSPFSLEAVRILAPLKMPFWKVASGELSNPELLDAVFATKLPVLLSSGMSDFAELDSVVAEMRRRGISFGVLQCTSEYPCPPEAWGLNHLAELRRRYGCPVGLSDHSGSIAAGLAATSLGGEIIEVHVAYDRKMFGPDSRASLTFEELNQLVKLSTEIKTAISHPTDKSAFAEKLKPLRKIFSRSWALDKDLPKGSIVTRADLRLKKPGTGISFSELDEVLGKRLKADKTTRYLLKREDFE